MSTEVDPNATAAAPEARVCPDCGSLAGAQPFCAQCGRKLSLIERLPAGAEANTEGTPTKKRGNKRMIVGLIVVVLGVLYFTGSLDRMLVNVGLNFKPCAQNGFGATMCGSQLKSYCQNLADNNLDPGSSTESTCSDVGVTLSSSSYSTNP